MTEKSIARQSWCERRELSSQIKQLLEDYTQRTGFIVTKINIKYDEPQGNSLGGTSAVFIDAIDVIEVFD